MNQTASSHCASIAGQRHKSGFTVIELLVAMSVLVIIVLIVSLIFRRASASWDAGMNRAELDMTGRGVADYVAQELSAALPVNFSASAGAASFKVLGVVSTNPAISSVSYAFSGGALSRNGTKVAEGLKAFEFVATPLVGEMPAYVDVIVTVTNEVGAESLYQSRAYFLNRNRYKL
jgi:prepilin-type N-terminal cleavage/methylation domain-containing protein